MEILDCPTCGVPTEVVSSYLLDSTDGPVEHLQLRCVRRHWFAMPREMLDRYGAGSGHAALAAVTRSAASAQRAWGPRTSVAPTSGWVSQSGRRASIPADPASPGSSCP